MSPLVSIVIPCYNHGLYLRDALNSIEKAKDKYPVEVIIVNDGSTDENTIRTLNEIEQEGYFIFHQKNSGLGNARNQGIKLSKGKYILPLDSDNKVRYPYLNTAIEILENNSSIDVVYGDAINFGEQKSEKINMHIDRKRMLISNHIDACAVYRKSLWNFIGGYAENMPYMGCEDWNFWLKCINKHKEFFYLEEICFEYRVLSSSMIRNTPDDFLYRTFQFNVNNLPELYYSSMKSDYDMLQSIFYGGIFRKTFKMVLDHFNISKYIKNN